jgi:sugar phosphate permease
VFGGRAARTCFFCALGCIGATAALWLAGDSPASATIILCVAGFFIYGPQALIGVVAANLATKRAAATATGLCGLFGYASTVLSGWGFGALAQAYGWDVCFKALLAVAVVIAVLFAFAWPAKAHGYDEPDSAPSLAA